MDIRLIISDIDSTILPPGGCVSPRTARAVARCAEKGVPFVIASGRWYPSALRVVREQLGLRDGYMIVCNGGAVVKTDGSVLMEGCMSRSQAERAWEILKDAPIMVTAYAPRAIHRLGRERFSLFELPEVSDFLSGESWLVTDGQEEKFFGEGLERPYKMEAYSDDFALLARLRVKLEEAGLQVNSSFPFNLEIMAPGAGKGMAVKWLTRRLGLEREQVMGFGDYTNDLPMLREVGWPVAVGNALDEVKAACRIIAPDCREDGVARTLEKYLLGDEEI